MEKTERPEAEKTVSKQIGSEEICEKGQPQLKEEKREKPTSFDSIMFKSNTGMTEKKLSSKPTVRLAIIGNVDSGKSTLCSVLTKGIMDDGRGGARERVFNYPHEEANGRTSSVGQEIMGWNGDGVQQFADRFVQSKNKYWAEVVSKSSKFVSLIDLCGHEKYLKTTMFGMVGLIPDFAMVIIGANMGISKMTKEHLGISLAIRLPFFVVMTKVDMVESVVTEKTVEELKALLKTNVINRKPFMVTKKEEVEMAAQAIMTDKIVPIFLVSSVSGESIDKLTRFIYLLKTRNQENDMIGSIDDPVEFDIHERFTVTGVGLVVSGTLKAGTIRPGQVLLCGPDKFKKFRLVVVKGVHVNRVPDEQAFAGSYCTLAIKSVNKKEELVKSDFRKGICLLDPIIDPTPIWEFEAEVFVLHHSTTIKIGYQAVMHCGVIRQTVAIEKMSNSILRAKERDNVKFKFLYHPEFLKPDSMIILREGRTKIIGIVKKVYKPTVDQSIVSDPPAQQDKPTLTIEEGKAN